MIVLAVKYRVASGAMDAVLDALRRMAARVREAEPGCRTYQVSRSAEEGDLLLLYEVYDDRAALDAHRATPHFAEIIAGEVIPRLASRTPELYELAIG